MAALEWRQMRSATRFCEGLNIASIPCISALLADLPELTRPVQDHAREGSEHILRIFVA
ncbi:hypothetical protein OE88DRAFT_1659591 [Heliocybe sulcata]|uniref:Uncharacterized protein n=1 Tax=Heliocybe sulcata TaxID=5364 RepID=A0A5C3N258_9AGAM|nr:hypothetical protein OE88DRAFT_1659591 [Heliocybe sulcata]